jgi:hypothetical protein
MHAIPCILTACALSLGATTATAGVPASWDGLVHVKSEKVAAVYILPNADFRSYTQVLFDPPQVAFRKNWALDYNSSQGDLSGDVSSTYVTKAVAMAQQDLAKVFPQSFAGSGITIAEVPGPHVLRLGVYILDLTVAAPDVSDAMGQPSQLTPAQRRSPSKRATL